VLFMIALNQLQISEGFRNYASVILQSRFYCSLNLDASVILESRFYCSPFAVHLSGCASGAIINMTKFPLLQTGAICMNPHRQTGAIRKFCAVVPFPREHNGAIRRGAKVQVKQHYGIRKDQRLSKVTTKH
jgi:hypothetical protein